MYYFKWFSNVAKYNIYYDIDTFNVSCLLQVYIEFELLMQYVMINIADYINNLNIAILYIYENLLWENNILKYFCSCI